MARGKNPQQPLIEPKVFTSLSEIEAGITKLRRRLKEVDDLDPRIIRYNDQRVRNIESNISTTIQEIFGTNSPEFREHGHHRIWHGGFFTDEDHARDQHSFTEGIPQSKTALENLIDRLEEKKLDFSSSVIETKVGNTQAEPANRERRVFISHGLTTDWREVQAFIEKDLNLLTLELAQEPNRGRTVLQKLEEESERCCYAVIVMTGDDKTEDGQRRTRENVIHEIGYFQGKFGLSNVCLLHEEGVNIPSNIHGLVYIPFPSGMVRATFAGLGRELLYG
jgi:predicted nucleotide-binding protein